MEGITLTGQAINNFLYFVFFVNDNTTYSLLVTISAIQF